MTDPIVFRESNEDDRAWAAALMASSEPWTTLGRTLEACQRTVEGERGAVVVATIASTRVGFAIVDSAGFAGGPYLKIIAVDALARSAGVGTALLNHVEERFGHASGNLFLCVSSFNERAKAWYERHGYVQIGAIDDYLVEGAAELMLRKRF